ncbi:carbamoyl-phosphate synthase large subunit [Enterobacteriaceae endosymbiont of Macroplea appendiculata]|uniref:carbamoyl-phosphate synthase large subunit n=1 Tax=Enterobacteriaceae endosymbiont of Macroplea appendiculata TaxID=2675790 RepID=UPI001448B019|nr:carbamoyl-phosphate synthase large subunit [Enterobacteriaceae endosymbiont of Macroplea appendiculata]QJC30802.1 carbamoyl-phosphate synthase large subunit [Enterobacteriaceae endosymbiont of Macroplea appendiculata]
MPKRTDIKSIMIIGSGPIVIGQACEFDYSGTQACKALKEEGYKLILINSNPATIMTDPDLADITYIEPITHETITKIIIKEKPDAILPTMGGQTALNCILQLYETNILTKYNVKIIGVTIQAIHRAENRNIFNKIIQQIGLNIAASYAVHNLQEALDVVKKIGYPCIIRPSYTMGGSGGGIAYNLQEFTNICAQGIILSPINELIIDESLIGWKEYELEMIRDVNGNCIVICSIENIDPMGIHTGDSITVAPAQTLSDKEYQIMRNAAISIMKNIGINSGGANVQFAVNPITGKLVVIEMNPRVSRSSALASKATGFPIAKISAKLSIGYTLDELNNDITNNKISAAFEPSIDYIVVKIPKFNFEKFHETNHRLSIQMKSVGEVMAIGTNFQEALQKALCSLDHNISGLDPKIFIQNNANTKKIIYELSHPGPNRIQFIADAFRFGITLMKIHQLSKIDVWFLDQIQDLINIEQKILTLGIQSLENKQFFRFLKQKGFSDMRIAKLVNSCEKDIRKLRYNKKIYPVYKRVDTCAAEFDTNTAYIYSTYSTECESYVTSNPKKIIILGSGPNRIGQGIEFDYCCVHAALALREKNFETIMVNCNPETVSTDYDISDKLYFEPLNIEKILDIINIEQPRGIIVQYGGQTPLNIAKHLAQEGVNILGTTPHNIDIAENRDKFKNIIHDLKLQQPTNYIVHNLKNALIQSDIIGYPVIVRPSYVLGGQAMQIVYNKAELIQYFLKNITHHTEILLDKFLDNAIEIDVDAICDGHDVFIGGIMEHIEQAGIHSGDSACVVPTYTINKSLITNIKQQVRKISYKMNICGLINIQFAIKNNQIYLIEVNPRASRTIPFLSKTIGLPMAKIGALVMAGYTLAQLNITREIIPKYFAIKESILPFNKFDGVDPILGPEMKSTGEIMGIGMTFAEAFSKIILHVDNKIYKLNSVVLLSLSHQDKKYSLVLTKQLINYGYKIEATPGTAKILQQHNIPVIVVDNNISKDLINNIKNRRYNYIIITALSPESIQKSKIIRITALQNNIYFNTTIKSAFATIASIVNHYTKNKIYALQELHKTLNLY